MSLYSEIDLPHKVGAHIDWQESWVLIFRDRKSGCVGFLRTGAYPNQGITQTHWGMALPDGTRFRSHLLDRKMEPNDRTETSASSGTMKFSIPNMEYVRFEAHHKDAEADLRLYDFYSSQQWEMIGASQSHDGGGGEAHGHPESAGRVEGRVRIGDRVIDIENGIGYREHGFGPRVIGQKPEELFRSARAHFGTVGPELSYSVITMHDARGGFHKMGYVMCDGVRKKIKDLHTINYTLGDGFSVVGGMTIVKLENDELIRINVETVDGVVTSTHLNNGGIGSSSAGIEALSIPTWNGLDGICDFNMIDNAHRGQLPVSHLLRANAEDGLSQRATDMEWVMKESGLTRLI
ncbi:hypothetical protein HCU74_00220 [Spongiibacter sp. KMU-166]|uniref:Uncharacterized protein n=1 Tax=Spongiibacter thalassae TaxID=2721624 RepID=A0ABX1GB58_9GAMM|nr:hypothetical protein [Spongiibacter thalassae]NKI15833.1 hypothetical protein [Spongiibacter thalassae]